MATTIETYGRLDVLVNNAGIAVLKPLDQLSLEDFNRQISVNLTSVFLGCKYAAAEMRKSGGGSLINLSSVAGLVGISTCVAYGASKGGVRLMSKSLAVELGKYGIRSNSVHPGVIWTNMQSGAGDGTRENADALAAGIPLAAGDDRHRPRRPDRRQGGPGVGAPRRPPVRRGQLARVPRPAPAMADGRWLSPAGGPCCRGRHK